MKRICYQKKAAAKKRALKRLIRSDSSKKRCPGRGWSRILQTLPWKYFPFAQPASRPSMKSMRKGIRSSKERNRHRISSYHYVKSFCLFTLLLFIWILVFPVVVFVVSVVIDVFKQAVCEGETISETLRGEQRLPVVPVPLQHKITFSTMFAINP